VEGPVSPRLLPLMQDRDRARPAIGREVLDSEISQITYSITSSAGGPSVAVALVPSQN